MEETKTVQSPPKSPSSGTPPSVARPAVGRGAVTSSPAQNVEEMQARCVRIYGLLRAGLITRFECDEAIAAIERHYGVRP